MEHCEVCKKNKCCKTVLGGIRVCQDRECAALIMRKPFEYMNEVVYVSKLVNRFKMELKQPSYQTTLRRLHGLENNGTDLLHDRGVQKVCRGVYRIQSGFKTYFISPCGMFIINGNPLIPLNRRILELYKPTEPLSLVNQKLQEEACYFLAPFLETLDNRKSIEKFIRIQRNKVRVNTHYKVGKIVEYYGQRYVITRISNDGYCMDLSATRENKLLLNVFVGTNNSQIRIVKKA